METKNVTAESPADKKTGKFIYDMVEIDGQKILFLVDEKDNRPVTERIKTFEDALNELGEEHQLVKEYRAIEGKVGNNLLAYQKICIIVDALNEGWKPDWPNREEKKWGTWFDILTAKETEDCVDEHEELWLFGGSSNNGPGCGLAYAYSNTAWTDAHSHISARLALKSEELADYCGKQFIDLWGEYLISC